ncbi:MAG: hypothetical protein E4H01_16730 [Lysobacterales bacterium]|nr:MAG: hypothetical protein E4H01_16730 [Xanthomonadales bacterium]
MGVGAGVGVVVGVPVALGVLLGDGVGVRVGVSEGVMVGYMVGETMMFTFGLAAGMAELVARAVLGVPGRQAVIPGVASKHTSKHINALCKQRPIVSISALAARFWDDYTRAR